MMSSLLFAPRCEPRQGEGTPFTGKDRIARLPFLYILFWPRPVEWIPRNSRELMRRGLRETIVPRWTIILSRLFFQPIFMSLISQRALVDSKLCDP